MSVPISSAVEFMTFRSCELRTVGFGFALSSASQIDTKLASTFAKSLSNQLDITKFPEKPTAYGKIFFTANPSNPNRFTCYCYQLKMSDATPVFCGNSIAAAGALTGQLSKISKMQFDVLSCDRVILASISAEIQPHSAHIKQEWHVHNQLLFKETNVLGHPAIECSIFNDYLIVKGPLQVATQELIQSWPKMDTIGGKIAILDPTASTTSVKFYNCNGLHGAAPLTGLATISLLSSEVEWINEATLDLIVQTPKCIERLPIIHKIDNKRTLIELPIVEVKLNKLI